MPYVDANLESATGKEPTDQFLAGGLFLVHTSSVLVKSISLVQPNSVLLNIETQCEQRRELYVRFSSIEAEITLTKPI